MPDEDIVIPLLMEIHGFISYFITNEGTQLGVIWCKALNLGSRGQPYTDNSMFKKGVKLSISLFRGLFPCSYSGEGIIGFSLNIVTLELKSIWLG